MDGVLNCDLKHPDEVVLKLPAWLHYTKPNSTDTVCIDREIVDTIKHLWKHEIHTLSSCSGHGKEPPNIVVASGYAKEDLDRIVALIAEVDQRKWVIFQWHLIKVRGPR